MKKINVGITFFFTASMFLTAGSVLAQSYEWRAEIKTPKNGQWTDLHLIFEIPYKGISGIPVITPHDSKGQSGGTDNKTWNVDFLPVGKALGGDVPVNITWKSGNNSLEKNKITYSFTPNGIDSKHPYGNEILGSGIPVTVQPVPEPLTILGSVAALGFGAYAERKRKSSKSSEKDNTKDS
jgi:hypothetical protein